jgi:hypothetical protein
MKKSITFFTVCINIFYAQGHGVVGKWKTIDDQSGEENQWWRFMKNQEKFWKST